MQKTLIISSGFIAGIPHRNPDLTVVALNDALNLVLEPTNTYDPQAIKIIHAPSGQFLGYVPREQNEAIHLAITEGFLPSTIVNLYQPQLKWKEIGYRTSVTFNS